MSWMCEIKERMLWLDRARTIQVTEGDDVDFSKKKTFFKIQSEKLLTVEPHYGRALSKTSGVPCCILEKEEKKVLSRLSDLVKCFSQTARCPTGASSRGMWLALGGRAGLPCRLNRGGAGPRPTTTRRLRRCSFVRR